MDVDSSAKGWSEDPRAPATVAGHGRNHSREKYEDASISCVRGRHRRPGPAGKAWPRMPLSVDRDLLPHGEFHDDLILATRNEREEASDDHNREIEL